MPLAPRRRDWVAAGLAALVVAAMMLLSGLPIGTWLSELEVAAPTAALQPTVDEALPIVRASEAALQRARTLHADGQLRSNASASAIQLARMPTGFEPTSSAISSRWQVFPAL